jgi:hypothetical protein
MDSWIDILTDPHHLLADFLMNVGFEITFAWLTYLILVRALVRKGSGKRVKRRATDKKKPTDSVL